MVSINVLVNISSFNEKEFTKIVLKPHCRLDVAEAKLDSKTIHLKICHKVLQFFICKNKAG